MKCVIVDQGRRHEVLIGGGGGADSYTETHLTRKNSFSDFGHGHLILQLLEV